MVQDLDISKINLEDEKVFSLLTTGETTGLFQLESTGMREAILTFTVSSTSKLSKRTAVRNSYPIFIAIAIYLIYNSAF